MNCIEAISGNVISAVHRVLKPSVAPATEYVPMPDGSSSEAPVMSPGPRTFRNRTAGFGSRSAVIAADSGPGTVSTCCIRYQKMHGVCQWRLSELVEIL